MYIYNCIILESQDYWLLVPNSRLLIDIVERIESYAIKGVLKHKLENDAPGFSFNSHIITGLFRGLFPLTEKHFGSLRKTPSGMLMPMVFDSLQDILPSIVNGASV